jgi:hypothetical protein
VSTFGDSKQEVNISESKEQGQGTWRKDLRGTTGSDGECPWDLLHWSMDSGHFVLDKMTIFLALMKVVWREYY